MKRIAIIDDHKLFSAGLQLLLAELDQPTQTDIFDRLTAFLDALEAGCGCHDLVILASHIPGFAINDFVGPLKSQCAGARVLVVSASVSPSDRKQAFAAGADGYMHRHAAAELFLNGIEALLDGADEVDCGDAIPGSAGKVNLTPRQLDILILASKGLSNKEIARALGISPETVKSHLSDIYQRFSVGNRLEAIEHARNYGLC